MSQGSSCGSEPGPSPDGLGPGFAFPRSATGARLRRSAPASDFPHLRTRRLRPRPTTSAHRLDRRADKSLRLLGRWPSAHYGCPCGRGLAALHPSQARPDQPPHDFADERHPAMAHHDYCDTVMALSYSLVGEAKSVRAAAVEARQATHPHLLARHARRLPSRQLRQCQDCNHTSRAVLGSCWVGSWQAAPRMTSPQRGAATERRGV